MTRRDDTLRLQHLLDASQKALEFTPGRTRADLDREEMLALAVIRLLEVVGEAARDITVELKEAHPEIPWNAMIGTRNRLIHGYFDVDWPVSSIVLAVPVRSPQSPPSPVRGHPAGMVTHRFPRYGTPLRVTASLPSLGTYRA